MLATSVIVTLDGAQVPIEREVFTNLFRNSVVSNYAGVRRALDGRPLQLSELLQLSAQAQIPYPLFFAPKAVVEEQIRLKTEKLMAGFTKASFSMHSRHKVELRDVELIVKDLLRKQELLRKYDSSLTKNDLVGLLRNSRRSVVDDTNRLMSAVGFTRADLRGSKSKGAALDLLIGRLEDKQVFVSRSAQHYMPQEMPRHVKFSGMTIKDRKVPFIFLATGDEGEHLGAIRTEDLHLGPAGSPHCPRDIRPGQLWRPHQGRELTACVRTRSRGTHAGRRAASHELPRSGVGEGCR
jgi:hypothetical protein